MHKLDIDKILSEMTLEEKASFCSGKTFWHLQDLERLNVPSIMVTDGPHGVRKQGGNGDHIGIEKSNPATCFPTAVGLASTWNNDLLYEMGEYLGIECRSDDVAVLLGPGANIKRHPLCGRNFEYFSEDPYLSGHMAKSLIQGVQSKGVGTSLKHYVANNQESNRMIVDTIVDERTLRELYLRSFEIPVREAQPWTVMCSYNKVNGVYASENYHLLTEILKEEWGHTGLVVTDWGACNDRVDGLAAGQEIEMPTSRGVNDARIVEAVKNGTLKEEVLNNSVRRVLDLISKSMDATQLEYDDKDHHEFARKVAQETMVLLKNDGILPLKDEDDVALIGAFAKTPRYQGSGSSLINPTILTTAYEVFEQRFGAVKYADGYQLKGENTDSKLLSEAVELAKNVDKVVLMIGLTDDFESEGFDRTHLRIPKSHVELLNAIYEVNQNIVVTLSNGSPIEMPWIDKTSAVLEQYLAGQASGLALVDVLYGDANPSGKLAETFPNSLDEFPANQNFPGERRQVVYTEGLYVGYRYYDSADIDPLFPFGYGLSYTTFEYGNIKVSKEKVSLEVTNTGKLAGADIVQMYVSKSDSAVYRPKQELKGYQKVFLQPGETKKVEISIVEKDLEIYPNNRFVLEDGEYYVHIGSSSRDIKFTDTISLKGEIVEENKVYKHIKDDFSPTFSDFEQLYGRKIAEPVPMRPFTLNSTVDEMSHVWLGRMLKKTIKGQMLKMFGNGENIPESMMLMMDAMLNEMPFRGMVRMNEGLPERKALGMLDMMNGKFFRGLGKLIK